MLLTIFAKIKFAKISEFTVFQSASLFNEQHGDYIEGNYTRYKWDDLLTIYPRVPSADNI